MIAVKLPRLASFLGGEICAVCHLGFAWWIDLFCAILLVDDIIRIEHFRGSEPA